MFNEAELLAELQPVSKPELVKRTGSRTQQQQTSHTLPGHLHRVDVVHDLNEQLKQRDCDAALEEIGEEILEQLAVTGGESHSGRSDSSLQRISCTVMP